MAEANFADVEVGANERETLENLYDAYYRMKRSLEHALLNLDSKNIKEIDANVTRVKNLIAETIITNTLITQSLYADRGYIAELTVDQLDTSTKIQNYLLHDTDHAASVADVNYIKIHDQTITYYTAVAINHPATVQATDRDGNPLYWDIIEGVVTHQATTLTANAYPITIWTYTDTIKMEQTFKLINGVYTAQTLYGAGTGTDNNAKGIIYKAFTDSKNVFHIGYFHSTTGAELGFTIDDDGVHSAGILPATDMDGEYLRNLYVGTAFPPNAPLKSLLDDTDDWSRHDFVQITTTAIIDTSMAECFECTGVVAYSVTIADTYASAGCVMFLKNSGSGIVTLVATIDGSATNVLYPGATKTIKFNGTAWRMM